MPCEQRRFFLVQVLLDGPVNHLALHSEHVHVAVGLAWTEVLFATGIAEFHELVVLGIPNVLPDDVVPVNLPLGHFFELVERCHRNRLPGDAVRGGDVQLHLRARDTPAAGYRRDEAHIRLVVSALHEGRRHLNLLHQLALVGVHHIELENHVVRFFRRRGIAQVTQRIHPLHGLLALAVEPAFHALRLVHDQDRAGSPDQIDGLLPARLFAGAIHHVLRFLASGGLVRFLRLSLLLVSEFVDRAHRHHHDLNLRAGRKVAHLAELRRIVNEEVEWRARVEPLEVLGRGLDGVIDAFLDRHRGHDDDELGEAVTLVQLKDSPQINIGLAGAGLHLYGEVARPERRRGYEAMAELNGVQIREEFFVEKGQSIAEPEVVFKK